MGKQGASWGLTDRHTDDFYFHFFFVVGSPCQLLSQVIGAQLISLQNQPHKIFTFNVTRLWPSHEDPSSSHRVS